MYMRKAEIMRLLTRVVFSGRRWIRAALVGVVCLAYCQGAEVRPERMCDMKNGNDMPLLIGGAGGVYLLAQPGPLEIEVGKRDAGGGPETHLRAILFGPDRRILDSAWIPDDGRGSAKGWGPLQTVRLKARIEAAGVCGLNITVTNDRYGKHAIWGFRTTCPHYLIETSRGHRDTRHEEPIVLRHAEVSGNVCFMPRKPSLRLDVRGLKAGIETLKVYDSAGTMLHEIPVATDHTATLTIPPAARRRVPWRVEFPQFWGEIAIDGVTRWDRGDRFAGLSLWTPDLSSWFPLLENRWLLTPYSRTVYGEAGEEVTLPFQVHNNNNKQINISLQIEGISSGIEKPGLSTSRVQLSPGRGESVVVHARIPASGSEWRCRLRASTGVAGTADFFSTYSSIILRRGPCPADHPLSLPLVLKPYQHENELLGYFPSYPTEQQVYFDLSNHPFVASGSRVFSRVDGVWRSVLLASAAGPARLRSSKVAFDDRNRVYVLVTASRRPALALSRDGGEHFEMTPLPGNGTFDIEQFSGHNIPRGVPPLARFRRTARDPKLRWRSLNDLDLIVPHLGPSGIDMGEPIPVSRRCIGLSAHSGIPSTLVSRGSKIHITWGEATDPADKVPGVPTYVATYDRNTRTLSKPVLVGYGPPANDVHNSPCITMDSKGFLHVLIGTHGRTFLYTRSLAPNDASAGWTPAEPLGPGLRQTYVGLVCAPDDSLHVVFRLWCHDSKIFPSGSFAALAHMSKRPGEPWSKPQILVVPPFSEYSIFYHRLTIDRRGRLFLSYDYWSTFWFYRTDHRGDRRALMLSEDLGKTWRLARDTDVGP